MSDFVAEGVGSFLGGISALIAVSGTAWQYFVHKRRGELETATALTATMSQDELIRFAVTCVDWGAGLIPVPEQWKQIIGSACIPQDVGKLSRALKVDLLPDIANDPVGMLYRHSFVALFDHLERIEQQLDRDAIHLKDLSSLRWLARNLFDWPYAKLLSLDGKIFFMPAASGWYDTEAPARLIRRLLGVCSPTDNARD